VSTVLRRSQLYVPGNNEKMIRKAATLNCDSVILDFEDAVPAGEKETARRLATRLASELDWGKRELCARPNSVRSPDGRLDLKKLKDVTRLDSIVVPKAENDLSFVHSFTGKNVIPVIETAKGLRELETVLRSKGVVAVGYAAADFALSVGGSVSAYLENAYVKTKIVVTARYLGIDAIDNVFFDLDDLELFRRQASDARDLGFVGKQLIHPSQIEAANEIFSPTKDELAWADQVVREYERARDAGKGAMRVDGELVDEVHYRLAKRILEHSSQS
jgi:citrate lyase subunit beta/citryl-CoA lyase